MKFKLHAKTTLFSVSFFIYTIIQAQTTNLTGPTGSGQFGARVTVLTNGNYVITDPGYDNGSILDVGAVYLYNGSTNILISTLKGTNTSDQVGTFGVLALNNGNYVVISPYWKNGTSASAGAVTWCNGNTGISGTVSSSNSLVGTSVSDVVGSNGVTALPNGNYVVKSSYWNKSGIGSVGAVTWGNGTTGITGSVSVSNSIIGNTQYDRIGFTGITILTNGNYVVKSQYWDNGVALDVGAVTWCNGNTGTNGIVTILNSIGGSTTSDDVGLDISGKDCISVLTNGNYVVRSPNWDNGTFIDAGAATWGNGITGTSGIISSSNSLIGGKNYDRISNDAVTILNNGNYVVVSSSWNNGALSSAGAATWGNGNIGVSGLVSSTNSLVGSKYGELLGVYGVIALTNGNYVVTSPNWSNNAGAATWGDGTTGVSGIINSSNSLVGSQLNDQVASAGVTALPNGNYVVKSPNWSNGIISTVGAATWGNGNTGITGLISNTNSLIGSSANDFVSNEGVVALKNGNYVVRTANWSNAGISYAGAATWGNGALGITGLVTISNSLVGSSGSDRIGSNGITALNNGNYVVNSSNWDNGGIVDVGAVTWGNGSTGTSGIIGVTNSLVGSKASDFVGGYGTTELSNSNYVVPSVACDNGSFVDAGAVTWGNGSTGTSGVVGVTNSLVGGKTNDNIGSDGIKILTNGNYVIVSASCDNGAAVDAGAVTWGNGSTGSNGVVNLSNSLLGSTSNDRIGSNNGTFPLSNGNYVMRSQTWDNGALTNVGAITWGSGASGTIGIINTCNSVLGSVVNGGGSLLLSENKIYSSIIVNGRNDNMVSIYNPSNQSIGQHLDNVTLFLSGIAPTPFINNNCRIITTILPTGTTAVSGSVTAKEWIENTQPTTYVKRHYEITPATNASTATGKVTLYFTQGEFDNFNTVSVIDLPTSSSDASGIANLFIEKRAGVSNDGTGLPNTYTGSIETINPADADIIWNAVASRWEVSFDVTGFSGFWVKTQTAVLPLRLLSFTASKNSNGNNLIWQTTNEINSKSFTIERSYNGNDFINIGSVNAIGNGNNNYNFIDADKFEAVVYYRLKMIDNDGKFTNSNIIKLTNSDFQVSVIYPNPTKDNATLQVSDRTLLNTEVKIFDTNGRMIRTFRIKNTVEKVNMIDLTSGLYLLKLSNGEIIKLFKL
jgi:hypothetical protein